MTSNNRLNLFRQDLEFHLTTEEEIISILKDAGSKNKSVYCYSAGFNWGYGAKSAVDPEAILINLSLMNKILSFDEHLGILKIQPGVTQGQLFDYLKTHGHDFYVPNTGAGKRGSLLGNALERGFGISPIHDHANSILSVRGILADGTIYESALKEIDHKLADCFSWGVGPQLDKMISQSSWLVITEVTMQLKRKNDCTDVLVLSFSRDELPLIFNAIRELQSFDDGNLGSIKIFNRRQVVLKDKYFINKEWFLTMVVYSHHMTRKSILKWTKIKIQKYLKQKILTFNSKKISFLLKIIPLIPFKAIANQLNSIKELSQLISLAEGETSEAGYRALDINYNYEGSELFDLNLLKKELVWLSPICPLDSKRAEDLLKLIEKLNDHQEDFKFNTFTWTVINQRTLALVIPIFYDREKEAEFWPWYRNIHLELKKGGFIPYRFHVKMMNTLRNDLVPNYFKHVEKFEKAFDPHSIILRGKYH